MRKLRHLLLCVLLLLSAGMAAHAQQTTKVRGRVMDDSGNPLPFASVVFQGTNIGITTDQSGNYSLETKDRNAVVLTAQLQGYQPEVASVQPGRFSTVNFIMTPLPGSGTVSQINSDNTRVRRLLGQIDSMRWRNDPDLREHYICRLYSKMQVAMTNPEMMLGRRFLGRRFPFAFDYIDTSSVSGMPYLPFLISETVSKRQHSSGNSIDSETIEANRISGVNPDNNLLSQFTGNTHLKLNFYSDFINALGVNFASPIMPQAQLYYDFFIVDTLVNEGREELLVRYRPKPLTSTPAFEGEMRIDASDFALRYIHADKGGAINVNHLRDFVVDADYQRLPDGTWFYKGDRYYVDATLTNNRDSRIQSFILKRNITYKEPDFETVPNAKTTDAPVTVLPDAGHKDEGYWTSMQPEPLDKREADIYPMVEKVQETSFYKGVYFLAYTLANGYYDVGNVGFGPYYKWISFNNTEGVRPQFGMQTSRGWSMVDRLSGYVAYGTQDKLFKGAIGWEHIFSKEPTRKLTIGAMHDRVQLGTPNDALFSGNVFFSIMGGASSDRSGMIGEYRAVYEHEFSPAVTAIAKLNIRRYLPNDYSVPMIAPDGSAVSGVSMNEMHLIGRFSKRETASRGIYNKTYIYSDYPIVTIDLAGSVPGLRKDDYGYLRPEASMSWRVYTPPFGKSEIYLNAGTILGQVPYPFLHIHEGNNTWLINKQAFSCMNYFEFASDTWASVFWNHSFGGFFLGKIPLIRRLQLREEFTFKATWGRLSDKNDGTWDGTFTGSAGGRTASQVCSPILFPIGMQPLGKVPYIEIGAGLSNILSILRVDFYWRLTHRYDAAAVGAAEGSGTVPGVGSGAAGSGTGATGGIVSGGTIIPVDRIPKNFAIKIGAEFRF